MQTKIEQTNDEEEIPTDDPITAMKDIGRHTKIAGVELMMHVASILTLAHLKEIEITMEVILHRH